MRCREPLPCFPLVYPTPTHNCKVHTDDDPPYYTIHVNGREKQTTGDRLFPIGTVPPPMPAEPAPPEPAPPASGFSFMTPTQAGPVDGLAAAGGGDSSYASAFAGDGAAPPGGPGSAFSFVHAADPNDAATNSQQSFDPTTAFKVDDAQDGSGSYAAQYAEQLANDPGYQVEPPPEASGVASGFGFLNKSTSVPVGGSEPLQQGTISGSDPGTPGASGFSFIKPGEGMPPPNDGGGGEAPGIGIGNGGGGFSFVNSTAAEEYAPETEEDLSAKVADEAGRRRQVLQQLLVQVKNQGEQLGALTATVRGMLWDIQSSHKECIRQVQQTTQQTILGLQQREQDLLLQANKAHAEKVAQLTAQAESLEAPLMQMRSGVGMWENAVCNSSHQDLLNMADEMQVQLQEMIKYEWDPNPACDAVLCFVPGEGLEIGKVQVEQEKKPEPAPPPAPEPREQEPPQSPQDPTDPAATELLVAVEEGASPPPPPLGGGGAFNLAGIGGASSAPEPAPCVEAEPEIEDLLSGAVDAATVGADNLLMPGTVDFGDVLSSGPPGDSTVPAAPPVVASTDELMDLFDVADLPKKVAAKEKKEKKSKEKKSKDKKGRRSPPPGETAKSPLPQGGPSDFALRQALSVKNAAAQFENIWTTAQLSHKASGRLNTKMTDASLNALMAQHMLVTIAGGAVNGIVKGYYMGEVDRPGAPAMVMLEVVMDPGALRLEATLKVSEPTTLPAFKEYMGRILEPLLS